MTRVFFDTNVLFYPVDVADQVKQQAAWSILQQQGSHVYPAISSQVLQEFVAVSTRKIKKPLSFDAARKAVTKLSFLDVIQVDRNLILGAIDRMQTMSISFWDGLIVEAALAARAEILYTEDLQHGQVIDGMRIESPFRDLQPS